MTAASYSWCWTIVKSKDGPTGTTQGFSLETVELGKDDQGDSVESRCVESTPGRLPTGNRREPTGSNQKIAMREINRLLQQVLPGAAVPKITVDAAVAAISAAITCAAKHKIERSRSAINSLVAGEFLEHREGSIWRP